MRKKAMSSLHSRKRTALKLGLSEGGSGEASAGDLDSLQVAAGEVEVGEVGGFDLRVVKAQAARVGGR